MKPTTIPPRKNKNLNINSNPLVYYSHFFGVLNGVKNRHFFKIIAYVLAKFGKEP
jgi:hypothetical protein